MKQAAFLIAGFLLASTLFTNTSCQKETDCKAVISCIDSAGKPVNNAYVELFALVKSYDGKTTYTADVKANGNTDNGGEVRFTFKLPAIYDVKATLATSVRTITGVGIIKLEEGQTVEKVITMK
jgi:hypothetical protein